MKLFKEQRLMSADSTKNLHSYTTFPSLLASEEKQQRDTK